MRCEKCGHKVNPDATFCTCCGNRLSVTEQSMESGGERKTKLTTKLYKKYFIIGLTIICLIVYLFGIRCESGFCLLPSGFAGEYCVIHTCEVDSCINKKAPNKNYCYTHLPTASSGFTYTPESADDVLEFSNIDISHNSSYTVCTGTITNDGKKTYTFVEVKGKFKDSSGTVLDTDWTYAVGSEGLAPGESTTFRLSVDKNTSIRKCTMEILDYDKK